MLERIKQSGYNHEIEMEINSILNDLGSSSCRLILNIIDILCDKEKIIFKDNIVLPYLHTLDTYAHVTDELKAEEMAGMNGFL